MIHSPLLIRILLVYEYIVMYKIFQTTPKSR